MLDFALIAPFAAGPLADWVGRKWALLSSTLFYVVSYILLATSSTVGQMYAARLIQVSFASIRYQMYKISVIQFFSECLKSGRK